MCAITTRSTNQRATAGHAGSGDLYRGSGSCEAGEAQSTATQVCLKEEPVLPGSSLLCHGESTQQPSGGQTPLHRYYFNANFINVFFFCLFCFRPQADTVSEVRHHGYMLKMSLHNNLQCRDLNASDLKVLKSNVGKDDGKLSRNPASDKWLKKRAK